MQHGYLRSDTLSEPLQWGWYAWALTAAPVQYGFYLTGTALPLLSTFVSNPESHIAAAEDPRMVSGPFVHLPKEAVPEVQGLVTATTQACQPWIDFSAAIVKFDKYLRTTSLGFSLDPSYQHVPPVLAGYVEAAYDLNNRPQLRVMEEMVYQGALSGAATQQMSLSLQRPDHRRPFFLNTPRLPSAGRLNLRIPFADPRWERLSKSRLKPDSVDQLAAELGVGPAERETFAGFFTQQPPDRLDPDHEGDGVRIRYFGHATVLVQSRKTSILVDSLFASVRDDEAAKLTWNDLPDFIDYLFLTHAHADHFSIESLLKLRGRIGTILVPRNNPMNLADPSMRLIIRALGFPSVRTMDSFEDIELADGKLTALPFMGEHNDLTIHSKHTLHISLSGRSLLFLADSGCVDPTIYHHISKVIGPVDDMFIGMECDGAPLTWLYSQFLTNRPSRKMDESRKLNGCNADQAWALTQAIKPRRTYVYAMGQEPWMTFLMGLAYTPDSMQIVESDKFVARCREAGIPSERIYGCQELAAD